MLIDGKFTNRSKFRAGVNTGKVPSEIQYIIVNMTPDILIQRIANYNFWIDLGIFRDKICEV